MVTKYNINLKLARHLFSYIYLLELLQSIKERVDEEIENYKLKDDDINI